MELSARRVVLDGGVPAIVTDARGATRPPVLYVHGMFSGAWMFDAFARRLAACGWPGAAIDLRGHGEGRPVPDIGRVSVREYIDDALAAARALGRPIVVGHSMGGL